MADSDIHLCQCSECLLGADQTIKRQHQKINLFISHLDQQQRRWFAAIEAERLGRGGMAVVSQMTGICPKSIQRGKWELGNVFTDLSAATEGHQDRVNGRRRGGQFSEDKYPDLETVLEEMLADEVAGDPMSEKRWIRSSLRKLSRRLRGQGINVGYSTVQRLLKKMGFTLRVNIKRRKGISPDSPERDEQFRYIAVAKEEFRARLFPVISVDTKKKELIGNFRNSGKAWGKKAEEVNTYDFRSIAVCRAVPYGIYDLAKNRGYVYVGTSNDTAEFSVDAIARWWKYDGQSQYETATEILILADGGGSNGWRSRAWKKQIQENLCDALGLTVTVCHYPPGCSKWNPVEHRLFSQISMNWSGKPLRTLDGMLGYIRGTSTSTGLTVKAYLQEGVYEKGESVTKKQMGELALKPHSVCPDWNYTIQPRNEPPIEAGPTN